MALTPLSAISPVDGRYRPATDPLGAFFSEGALIRYRVMVEIEYFIALCALPLPQLQNVPDGTGAALRKICSDFSETDAQRIKDIEKTTNHDVKAVEYFIKEKFDALNLGPFKEFVHFGLTSQDINNTAMPAMLKDAWHRVMLPELETVVNDLAERAAQWKQVPMLARTHGQPASPTTLGKEIFVFVDRLRGQLAQLSAVPFSAKFGGATGNFNAHHAAYPDIDWIGFANRLVNETLGLCRAPVTTQIEPYDHLSAFCHAASRINTILIDLARDVWTYISMNYFRQRIKAGEVGSSAMPHKVNPIDFENAEGNLGVANALLCHLAEKLPVSRLQRDLTDSTVTRNLGVPLAHMLIAFKSIRKGLDKLLLDTAAIEQDLDANWAVVAEAVQTVLRREGYPAPYEALKALTRTNEKIGADSMAAFIDGLAVSQEVKAELKGICPRTYTGILPF